MSTLPTIRDVAQAAGVSPAVVSIVLRNSSGSTIRVSEPTRQRVLEAAKRLSYSPSVIARGLRRQKSYLVGLVLRDVNMQISGNLLRGLHASLARHECSPLVHVYSDAQDEAVEVARCLERRVDGLIVNAHRHAAPESRAAWMSQLSVPLVELWGNYLSNAEAPSIEIDFEADGAAATRHLLDLGHSEIVHLTHAQYQQFPTASRFAHGYVNAMESRGLEPRIATHAFSGERSWEEGFIRGGEAAFDALRNQRARLSGVVCYSDYQAYGVLRAASHCHMAVPEQLSVMGHYDMEVSRITSPALTTLRIAAERSGAVAGETIVRLSQGEQVPSQKLASELVLRESTSKATLAA